MKSIIQILRDIFSQIALWRKQTTIPIPTPALTCPISNIEDIKTEEVDDVEIIHPDSPFAVIEDYDVTVVTPYDLPSDSTFTFYEDFVDKGDTTR